ncbi:HD domain-containing phosphohydrolase [Lacrimispora sphenoides]|uniref:PAS domain S-box-containing protein/diguanylate cyclase (GGDEF) domain-containing protein/HDIG domain-containing protein n=1 Tax=Lacrimispora sphenoides JCM 1415 TaxID=1297793 RepID=A0ABY1C1R3_9FIRM|nr:HD domain-containing phosphohydrolase [Lacrimispora sphenoides]SET53674.1 PAS domain S-box-containing protein/diguanylate cyclase (GGDEF) domain-containing protein/HDIG domain-containing protein [[Clostridium] sphenoides JCM 1415]SUY49656.1 diguanylate cyclase and metal dependent phosphohydrolase [Lacrimispora sphenoides]
MIKWLKGKMSDFKRKKDPLKQERIKICFMYLIFGFVWIYFSDRIVNRLVYNPSVRMVIHTYKGMVYVLFTASVLYYLISNLLRKVEQADQKLRVSEEKYKAVINQMQFGMALYEGASGEDLFKYRLVDSNHSYEILTGLKKEEIIGKYFFQIHEDMAPENLEKLIRTIKTGESTSYEQFQKNTYYYYEVLASRPKENQLAIILNDITKSKQAEDRLHYLSYHDQLTGLYNRRFFEEQLLQLNSRIYYPLIITMADINGLKLMNDSFGHTAGDIYIQKVAEVLREGFREKDIISRLGGDEFIILSPNTDTAEIKELIGRINERTKHEAVNKVTLSVSFGYSVKYREEESILEVLRKAEDFMYKKKLLISAGIRGKTIYTVMAALHEKNPREEQHSLRVSELCEKMGTALGLQEDEVKELKTVGLLHDIGKVAIEEGILNKNGKLVDQEWVEIKKHPEIGYRILSSVNELSEMAGYVLAHHERWDGNGYPKGLKGNEIPVQSRIIAIADAYDAMISERSYRHALPKEYAISELVKGAGTQFCREYVHVFIDKVVYDVKVSV